MHQDSKGLSASTPTSHHKHRWCFQRSVMSKTGFSPDPHVPKKRAVVSWLELSHVNSSPRLCWNNLCLNFKMPAEIIVTKGMFLKMKHITMAETLESGRSDVCSVWAMCLQWPKRPLRHAQDYLETEVPSLHLPFLCSLDGNFCNTLWWDQNLPCSLFKPGKKPGLNLAFLSKQQQILKIKE